MQPMYVLTAKKDGGTQDVVGFYTPEEFSEAMLDAKMFLKQSQDSRRAIIRLEYYNPGAPPPSLLSDEEIEAAESCDEHFERCGDS